MEDPVVPLERNLYGHPLAILFPLRRSMRTRSSRRPRHTLCRALKFSEDESVFAETLGNLVRSRSV